MKVLYHSFCRLSLGNVTKVMESDLVKSIGGIKNAVGVTGDDKTIAFRNTISHVDIVFSRPIAGIGRIFKHAKMFPVEYAFIGSGNGKVWVKCGVSKFDFFFVFKMNIVGEEEVD